MSITTTQPSQTRATSDVLSVVIEIDELRSLHGHRIDSPYVDDFWTAIIGPTGVATLRLIARRSVADPYLVSFSELAESLGVSANGFHSPSRKALRRLVRFGAARWLSVDESAIAIYSHIHPVPLRLRQQWSPALQSRHATHDA